MKLLILNSFSRNSLSAAYALKGKYEIFGATRKPSKNWVSKIQKKYKSPAFRDIFYYESPKNPEAFIQSIASICNKNQIAGVIPTGTTTTNILSEFKSYFSELCKAQAIVDDYARLGRLTDKWETVLIAKAAGVRVPRTILLADTDECMSEIDSFHFPVVVKPRMSYAALGVCFFNNAEEVKNYLRRLVAESGLDFKKSRPLIMQERIVGTLHDAAGCAANGELRSVLTQQRHVSLYDFGGGGIINRTTNEPELKELAKKIVQAVSWNGIFEFDFMRNDKNEYYLIECNPKIWGTNHLCVAAGINVIDQAVDLFLNRKFPDKAFTYEEDLLCKFWFPEIVAHWFTRPFGPLRILRRIFRCFNKFGAKRSITNIKTSDFPHMLSVIFDRVDA